MSMNLHIYVGPYVEIPAGFGNDVMDDLEEWLVDGRGECENENGVTILVPNFKLEKIRRQTEWDKWSETPVAQLSAADIQAEAHAFCKECHDALAVLCERNINYEVRWGVVPKYS